MANTITGRNAAIGEVVEMPITPPSHPHWKIATTTPNEAATLSRFIAIAFTATNTERKTISSRSAEISTTAPMKSGSLLASKLLKSANNAVVPPTYTAAFVLGSSGGITLSRSRFSSVVVAAAWGEVLRSEEHT